MPRGNIDEIRNRKEAMRNLIPSAPQLDGPKTSITTSRVGDNFQPQETKSTIHHSSQPTSIIHPIVAETRHTMTRTSDHNTPKTTTASSVQVVNYPTTPVNHPVSSYNSQEQNRINTKLDEQHAVKAALKKESVQEKLLYDNSMYNASIRSERSKRDINNVISSPLSTQPAIVKTNITTTERVSDHTTPQRTATRSVEHHSYLSDNHQPKFYMRNESSMYPSLSSQTSHHSNYYKPPLPTAPLSRSSPFYMHTSPNVSMTNNDSYVYHSKPFTATQPSRHSNYTNIPSNIDIAKNNNDNANIFLGILSVFLLGSSITLFKNLKHMNRTFNNLMFGTALITGVAGLACLVSTGVRAYKNMKSDEVRKGTAYARNIHR